MVPSVELAKKAEAFDVTPDYLADNTGAVQIKDRTMLQRLIDIETLGQEDLRRAGLIAPPFSSNVTPK
jgi:hypothetical protein